MLIVSDQKDKLQPERIFELLGQAYWAKGRSHETILRSIENSLCFGAYDADTGLQIGFARAITDFATTYYVCDVFVDPAYRGMGAGKALVAAIAGDARLKGLRGVLASQNAKGLYEKFGFQARDGLFMSRNPE